MPHYNESLDDTPETEVQLDFAGGMDSFTRPDILPANGYRRAVNCLPADGLRLTTRPGSEVLGSSSLAGCQGVHFLSLSSGYQRIVMADGGTVREWDGTVWATAIGHTTSTASLAMATIGERLWVADGTARLWTWSGAAWVERDDSTGPKGGPTAGASLLATCGNRLVAGGYAGEPDRLEFSPLLADGQWNGGTTWGLRVGGDAEPIRAICPMQNNLLAVLKTESCYMVSMDPAATSAADFGILAISRGAGGVGSRAWARVGDDLHYWSRDGVRSLGRMQGDGASYTTSAPLSTPVQDYVDRVNPAALTTIAAIYYGRYVLWAVPLDTATTPDTVLVWDVRLARWVSVFTGWAPRQWAVSNFSTYGLRLLWGEQAGELRQWLDRESTEDPDTYLDDGEPYTATLRLRAMVFQNGLVSKNGDRSEFRFRDTLANPVTLRAIYDDATVTTKSVAVTQNHPTLPATLPFTLGTVKPVVGAVYLPLSPIFRTLELEVEAAGKFSLYEARASAWLNPLDQP